jgi:hypothetical protein
MALAKARKRGNQITMLRNARPVEATTRFRQAAM